MRGEAAEGPPSKRMCNRPPSGYSACVKRSEEIAPERGAAPATERGERSEILLGVPVAPGEPCCPDLTARLTTELRLAFPARPATVVYLAPRGTHGALQAVLADASPSLPADAAGAAATMERPSPLAGGFTGARSALPALLREARRRDVAVCALVSPVRHDATTDWLRLLVTPVAEQGYDFVCPAYRRRKLDGALITGIAYPLTRALFGQRLRQPLGGELALSRRFADLLLDDDTWQREPAHAGTDVWVVGAALSDDHRVCQAFLGGAPEEGGEKPADASEALSRVLGLLFREVERRAPIWQRITGSEPVATFGAGGVLEGEAQAPNVARLVDAFDLGRRQLREVWTRALPANTLFSLSRLSREPVDTFRVPDELWARVVYDFALAYHQRLMDRAQLLRSMTPLYLGWLASFANGVRDLDGPGTEERVERLCQAFEGAKPYLIARWRWPDRFSP